MAWRPCVSAKCRKRLACERRCAGLFVSDPQYIKGCKKFCFEYYDKIYTRCDYLQLADIEDQFIVARQYDPCEGGATISDLTKPWEQLGEGRESGLGLSRNLLIGLGVGAAVLLLVLILLIRKR